MLSHVRGSWGDLGDRGRCAPFRLDASAVDVPLRFGICDPARIAVVDGATLFSSAAFVFPSPDVGLCHFIGFYAGPRTEYIKLCVLQLRAFWLRHARSYNGDGIAFPVAKVDGRQRAVWLGTRASHVAAPPPKPRHLVNPSVFGYLELIEGRRLRVSKRDCRI